MSETKTTIDTNEVDKFASLAETWWDPAGKMKPLHKFNPVRLSYIKEHVCRHFERSMTSPDPFDGLRLLDVGCGGGLLCEPVARLGAEVVGVDPAETNIEVARLHARQSDLEIDYRASTAEALQAGGETFDIVLAMEVVEHVADVELFLRSAAQMVRPNGLMFVATINRTLKAFGLAIVGAEYVLGWLPRGTHQYEKLVRPNEIEAPLDAQDMNIVETVGVSYNPLSGQWSQSRDTDVNYMMLAERSEKTVD